MQRHTVPDADGRRDASVRRRRKGAQFRSRNACDRRVMVGASFVHGGRGHTCNRHVCVPEVTTVEVDVDNEGDDRPDAKDARRKPESPENPHLASLASWRFLSDGAFSSPLDDGL